MAELTDQGGDRLAGLDGLRAAAVALVMLFHLTPGRVSHHGLQSVVFKVADIGWSGVDLFFVLSGFLITRLLLKGIDRGEGLAGYFVRRLLRIVPLYYLALLFFLVLLPGAGVFAETYREPDPRWPLWLFASNYFTKMGFFGHFWSLAIEMQYYLVWPVILVSVSRRTAIRLCLVLLVASVAIRAGLYFAGMDYAATHRWTPSHLDGLVTGSLLALGAARRHGLERFASAARWIAVGAAAPLAFVAWKGQGGLLFHAETRSGMHFLVRVVLPSAVAILCGALLVVAIGGGMKGVLQGRVQSALARYSYGMYVYHFLMTPFFIDWFPPAAFQRAGLSVDQSIYLHFLLGAGTTLAIAATSFHLYEQRFLRLKELVR